MIEFTGYICGAAERRFQYNNKIMGVKLIVAAWLLVVPSVIIFGIKAQNWLMVILCGATFFIIPIFALIPQGEKEKKSLTPKKIIIDDGCIVCKTDKEVVSRLLEDVEKVKDYGDFYELVFPFGKKSTRFICQKDLITKGTLEEFEALFAEKIEKQHSVART